MQRTASPLWPPILCQACPAPQHPLPRSPAGPVAVLSHRRRAAAGASGTCLRTRVRRHAAQRRGRHCPAGRLPGRRDAGGHVVPRAGQHAGGWWWCDTLLIHSYRDGLVGQDGVTRGATWYPVLGSMAGSGGLGHVGEGAWEPVYRNVCVLCRTVEGCHKAAP